MWKEFWSVEQITSYVTEITVILSFQLAFLVPIRETFPFLLIQIWLNFTFKSFSNQTRKIPCSRTVGNWGAGVQLFTAQILAGIESKLFPSKYLGLLYTFPLPPRFPDLSTALSKRPRKKRRGNEIRIFFCHFYIL